MPVVGQGLAEKKTDGKLSIINKAEYVQPVPEKLLLEEDTLLGDRVRYIKEWTRFYAILCSEF